MKQIGLPTIGYLSQVFPSLSTTFVYREVIGLRQEGWNIATFSIWKPFFTQLSAEAKHLVDGTFYVFPLNVKAFLKAHLYYALTSPIRYLWTLALVMTQPQESLKKKLRSLAHFGEAGYLAREMELKGIKHVHATFAHTANVALTISKLTGLTFSFTSHARDIYADDRLFMPTKLNAAKFVVTISDYNRRYLSGLVGHQDVEKKIYIVHCAVDVKTFSPPLRKEQSSCPLILSIGRLVDKKGFPYLIKACKILVQKGYKFRCQIIGDGPQQALLRSLIANNGLSEYVELVGVVFQERIRDYFQRAEIFVLPCMVADDGDQDGIPVVLMEAMAMQIPVISTTLSGIPELLRHGEEGLLVTQKDEMALADAMALLLENEDMRQRFGKAGRERIKTDFNLATTTAQLSEIFRRQLTER